MTGDNVNELLKKVPEINLETLGEIRIAVHEELGELWATYAQLLPTSTARDPTSEAIFKYYSHLPPANSEEMGGIIYDAITGLCTFPHEEPATLVDISEDGATSSEDNFRAECHKSKQLLGMLITLVASEVADLQAVSRWVEVQH